MCLTIQPDKKLDFAGKTRECLLCDDGKSYHYTETCPECKGKKRFLKGTRHYKCKSCAGKGYVMLNEKKLAGDCTHCHGTLRVPLTAYDNMTEEDREWIFNNLFNFDKPYSHPTSSFNESYLGFGIVCGVTDYGRYRKMNPVEFKNEVRENFMRGYGQYITLLNKEGKLPQEICIKRTESGWHAYPVH